MPISHSSQNLPAEVRPLEEENRLKEKILATAANKPLRGCHLPRVRLAQSRSRNLLPRLIMPPARSPRSRPRPERKGEGGYGTGKLVPFDASHRPRRCYGRSCLPRLRPPPF